MVYIGFFGVYFGSQKIQLCTNKFIFSSSQNCIWRLNGKSFLKKYFTNTGEIGNIAYCPYIKNKGPWERYSKTSASNLYTVMFALCFVIPWTLLFYFWRNLFGKQKNYKIIKKGFVPYHKNCFCQQTYICRTCLHLKGKSCLWHDLLSC